jgi:hypothetical protein
MFTIDNAASTERVAAAEKSWSRKLSLRSRGRFERTCDRRIPPLRRSHNHEGPGIRQVTSGYMTSGCMTCVLPGARALAATSTRARYQPLIAITNTR